MQKTNEEKLFQMIHEIKSIRESLDRSYKDNRWMEKVLRASPRVGNSKAKLEEALRRSREL